MWAEAEAEEGATFCFTPPEPAASASIRCAGRLLRRRRLSWRAARGKLTAERRDTLHVHHVLVKWQGMSTNLEQRPQ